MNKIIRIGKYENTPHSLFCKIELTGGKLSINGVEGPKRNGDCHGGCGQIVMHEWDITEYAPGWDADAVAMFRATWKRWHLNDMVAGSPAQMAYLRANPIAAVYPESHFTKSCEALQAAGLQPDEGYQRNGKDYSYGSAWLREELPDSVVAYLESLPDADMTPAWV